MKKIILVIGVLALAGFTTWWLQDAPLDVAARQWLDTTPGKVRRWFSGKKTILICHFPIATGI